MKIEPRKIKKTLKYAAVGTCVATSLVSVGCQKEEPVLPGGAPPIEYTQPTEDVYLDGDIASTPAPTIKNLPTEENTPEPLDLQLSGDFATEPTPELSGGIPTPFDYEEDEEYELVTSGTPPVR